MTTTVFPILVLIAVSSGCISAPERELSSERANYSVLVTGRDPLDLDRFISTNQGERAAHRSLFRHYERERGRALNILLLSGGGQNGAFGAGFIKGWRESGRRPEFDIVTGVSTGALLATHAFLGTPADDAVLEGIFTGVEAPDIYTEKGVFGVLFGANSLFDTAPLDALLKRVITPEMIALVAAEHDEGRRLFVATTNLDYNQTWVWDLTLLAKQGGPDVLERYRKILMASSAFPIMFPPVEIDGHLFVDGAVRMNLLVVGLSGRDRPPPPLYGPGNVYVIQNGRLETPPEAVTASIGALAANSIAEMMASSMERLLVRSYFATQVNGYRYSAVEIPADVDVGSNALAFDQTQMRAGFDAGYELGQSPDPWSDEPTLLGDFPDWALDVMNRRKR
ncbi:MAG: patatin-like phospholipase family protein [Deltaproteobacteria bacterium]|jgi:hypothetical protein|nr:patatin-like phospholipase family protein [Deltaproteobacteria bacterium]MBW2542716.1 patatin-like phospholipase family protein [Deltaproteobacteria bacterium]